MTDRFGYLLVHFVEAHHGHGERIYLSLSEGDDPLHWRRLNGGEPILESTAGSTGVRDPHLVRRHDGTGFHILATDLRLFGTGTEIDWDALSRHGSRDLVFWDSPDLLTWSEPRYVTLAPPEAGMAWAPEAHWDEAAGAYRVYWSSKLFAPDDVAHEGESYSRILSSTTADFREFTPARVHLDQGVEVIDQTVALDGDRIFRFAKDNDGAGRGVFQEVAAGFDGPWTPVAEGLGRGFDEGVEAPLVFHDNAAERWWLWVDQYGRGVHRYQALHTADLASGEWSAVAPEDFHLPAETKHGTVLPLTRAEWAALDAAL